MKFAFGIAAFTLGYTVFYYALYMIWKYDPGNPGNTHAVPLTVLLGNTPDQQKSPTLWASPPFRY